MESYLDGKSINGNDLQKIILPKDIGFSEMRLHPDGKQVAFSMQDLKYEIWRVENFLPEQPENK